MIGHFGREDPIAAQTQPRYPLQDTLAARCEVGPVGREGILRQEAANGQKLAMGHPLYDVPQVGVKGLAMRSR